MVSLQAGDSTTLAAWDYICHLSRVEFQSIYELLNINKRLVERGESAYNPDLPLVVNELMASKIAIENDGAKVVFLPVAGDNSRKKSDKSKKSADNNKSSAGTAAVEAAADTTTAAVETHNTNTTPIVIQKSDGGYLYSTTDIAALRQRIYKGQWLSWCV